MMKTVTRPTLGPTPTEERVLKFFISAEIEFKHRIITHAAVAMELKTPFEEANVVLRETVRKGQLKSVGSNLYSITQAGRDAANSNSQEGRSPP